MAHGSRLMAHASRLVAEGSWLMAKNNLARGPPGPGPAPQILLGHEPRALSRDPWGMSEEP